MTERGATTCELGMLDKYTATRYIAAMTDLAASPTLNEAQARAARHGVVPGGTPPGPLLVIAGAGTGKTRTLAQRVAELLMAGADPSRIMLLTFSRRAAKEMVTRARRAAAASMANGHKVRLPWAGTFHSVAHRILRRVALRVGLEPAFSVLDRGDSADLIDVCRQALGLHKTDKRFPRKEACLDIYSRRVNSQRPLAEVLKQQFPWCVEWERELTELFKDYVAAKKDAAAVDYDDLLLYWYYMSRDEAMCAELAANFDHILVDEYQDTNRLQADILLAMKPDGRGLTVVGDDAQSIYGFRAADVENILTFPDRFTPRAKICRLEQNYRSHQAVLDLANQLMAEGKRRFDKALYSALPAGEQPAYVTVMDDRAQCDYIIEEILRGRERGLLLRQQAVLFRNANHSDALEIELTRRNIPFVKYGGLKFLEAAHVKDFLGVLRWAGNPRDKIAAFRTMQLLPGVGPGLAARAWTSFERAGFENAALARTAMPAGVLPAWRALCDELTALADPAASWPGELDRMLEWYRPLAEIKFESPEVRMADLEQLAHITASFTDRAQFLAELTLDPPVATGDLAGDPLLDEDYLILSTVHSAKGQEWDAVFILNVADGNFPSEFATGDEAMIEEERRLLYVAITRAKRNLHLMYPMRYYVPQQRRHGDRHVYGAKSRFMTSTVLTNCREKFFGERDAEAGLSPVGPAVDIAAKIHELW